MIHYAKQKTKQNKANEKKTQRRKEKSYNWFGLVWLLLSSPIGASRGHIGFAECVYICIYIYIYKEALRVLQIVYN